jgi:nicotinamidase-related amidase
MELEQTTSFRSPELLQAESSRLLIVDVQEKFLPTLPDVPRLISGCRMLIEAARLFSVPIFATEQYPQGLGPMTKELADLLPERSVKQEFSCCRALGWPAAAEDATGRYQVVVAGIETHVCILQTALELQSAGYRVFVVADAVASRREIDRQIALQRMMSSGVTLVTTESVGFEWCEGSDRPEFKGWSRVVKERPI